ncbi:MAG: hypothetical protein IID41_08570 [Planctomycetes bacterium]|nr:hypothetical protein [Planctomycetota bacterium]
MTETQTITLTLPPLYPKQHAAIFCDERYGLIEASTKSGKTMGCMVWLMRIAWEQGRFGRNYWWIAPTYSVAMIAYARISRMLARADPEMNIWSQNKGDSWIELASGGRIWFKGADKPDALFGEDVFAAVIDEATRCKEDAWFALRTTLTHTKGPVRIIGNVKGRRNWAYNMARKAEAGEIGMHYAKLTAYDAIEAGVLDDAEVADAKRILPDNIFKELYLAQPSDDGGNPFGISAIQACIVPDLNAGPSACYGIDLAKSMDWTVVIGFDDQGRISEVHRWQGLWEETIKRIIKIIGDLPTLIDATGVGDPIVERLQLQCCNVEGFVFTQKSKQEIMLGLAVAIQNNDIQLPDERWLIDELESFGYEYTRTGVRYEAPQGLHDDGVCALALANKHRVHAMARDVHIGVINYGGFAA